MRNDKSESRFDRTRLIELVGRLCDELISDAEFRELEEMLQASTEARQLYHVCVTLHQNLESRAASGITSPDQVSVTKPQCPEPSKARSWSGGRVMEVTTAVCLLIVTAIGLVWRMWPSEPSIAAAVVVDLVDVKWNQDTKALRINEPCAPGRLGFQSGVAKFGFTEGALVTIEGPADFEILSGDQIVVHSGKLGAYVPSGAEGFQVKTPHVDVVDLGTEFALRVEPGNGSQVHVFDGEVELDSKLVRSDKRIITAGLAVAVDNAGNSSDVAIQEEIFDEVRKMLRKQTRISTLFRRGNGEDFPGKFPGKIGVGWTRPWNLDVQNGRVVEEETGVTDADPMDSDVYKFGWDNYLQVVAQGESENEPFTVLLSRGYGLHKYFDLHRPYMIEFKIRFSSDVNDIQRLRLLGAPELEVGKPGTPNWQFEVARHSEGNALVQWRDPTEGQTALLEPIAMAVETGRIYRVLLEIQPGLGVRRAILSNGKHTMWSERTSDRPPVPADDDNEEALYWQIEVAGGKRVELNLDSFCIYNMAVVGAPQTSDSVSSP